ncbi:MAG: transporter [Phenylobacterium sp.]|nr:transporter [Phenylobacterium sp.]
MPDQGGRGEFVAEGAAASARRWSTPYKIYFLAIIALTFVCNYVDRTMLGAMVEAIKADLSISDGQIGLVAGAAFSLFYATAGLPLARLADRSDRIRMISIAMVVWSICTSACGFAGNFFQLLLARAGVAAGESAGQPPAYSMISDLFTPKARSTATAIFQVGGTIGGALGLALGGLLASHLGWRGAFMVMCVPGLILALITWTTLRDPPRGLSEGRVMDEQAPPAVTVVKLVLSRPTFVCTALGCGLMNYAMFSLLTWMPAFLSRSHHLTMAQAGGLAGAIEMVGGLLGAIGGAIIVDLAGQRHERWRLLIPSIAALLSAPLMVAFLFSGSLYLAAGCLAACTVLMRFWMGSSYTVVQRLVGLRMRTVTTAVLLFAINIVGMGLGPWIVGSISDLTAHVGGANSLRLGLLSTVPALLISGALLLVAAWNLPRDLARAPE